MENCYWRRSISHDIPEHLQNLDLADCRVAQESEDIHDEGFHCGVFARIPNGKSSGIDHHSQLNRHQATGQPDIQTYITPPKTSDLQTKTVTH